MTLQWQKENKILKKVKKNFLGSNNNFSVSYIPFLNLYNSWVLKQATRQEMWWLGSKRRVYRQSNMDGEKLSEVVSTVYRR